MKFSVLGSQYSIVRSGALALVASISFVWPAAGQAPGAAQAPSTRPAAELRPILTPEAQREAARGLIDRFVAHVTHSASIPAAARSAVVEGWKQHRTDEQPADFLEAALAIASEPYKIAMQAMDAGQFEKIQPALEPVLDSPDPYIALHAQGLLARALVDEDKLDEAQPLLEKLAAREDELMEKTFIEAEIDFLLGYCQLANLDYDRAYETLSDFERQHPNAPERLQLPARQMLQELAVRKPEGLGEVSDLMVYASRRLAHGQTHTPVQQRQERAVELLDKLIKEAEQQEQQQQQSNSGGGGGSNRSQSRSSGRADGQRSQSPAQESMRPGGQGRIGELHRSAHARPGEDWGKMPPAERERILQSLRRNFPSQYRELVEQYYKQLAKER